MSNKTQLEIRSLPEVPVAGDNRVISGYAIVFGVESRVLCDWEGEFIEVIEQGAVDDSLIERCDIKALFNHNHNQLLARRYYGEGSLQLSVDSHGLRFEFVAPETTLGNDILELVRRGDLRGCSFAFVADAENIEYKRRGEDRLRTVKRLSSLHDISIVVDPAYTQTSVDVRAFEDSERKDAKPCGLSPELAQLRATLRREIDLSNTNL